MTTTYPRIDADRGMAAQVVRYPGRKVCARIAWRTLSSIPVPPSPSPVTRLLPRPDALLSICLTACRTVIRDRWPRASQPIIHRAMVTARRILEGGGTVRAAVYHALYQLDDEPKGA